MKSDKQQSGVWQHLEHSGVLENGTAEEIAAARVAYWKQYKRDWKKQKRTSYTIALTHKENKELERAAKAHYRAATTFIKEALFAYINRSFVVPDRAAVDEIRILLARNYHLLQKLEDDDSEGAKSNSVLLLMGKLEKAVLRCLTTPTCNSAPPQSNVL